MGVVKLVALGSTLRRGGNLMNEQPATIADTGEVCN